MLAGLDRLEADEGHDHGREGADDVEGAVGNVQARRVPAHEDEDKDMQGNQVDDEHVATPRGHLRFF